MNFKCAHHVSPRFSSGCELSSEADEEAMNNYRTWPQRSFFIAAGGSPVPQLTSAVVCPQHGEIRRQCLLALLKWFGRRWRADA